LQQQNSYASEVCCLFHCFVEFLRRSHKNQSAPQFLIFPHSTSSMTALSIQPRQRQRTEIFSPSSLKDLDGSNVTVATRADSSTNSLDFTVYDIVEVDLNDSKKNTHSRKISFSTIEVREYPIIPGANPASFAGVPVTIGWTPVEAATLTVEEYESNKPEARTMVELRMPPCYRDDLLRRLGFSRSEILSSLKTANIVRNQRRRTSETMQLARTQEALEKVKRATLNATVLRGKKSQERKLLQRFSSTSLISQDTQTTKDDSRHTTVTASSAEKDLEVSFVDKGKISSRKGQLRHRDSIMVRR
jgi:hypothetical protein